MEQCLALKFMELKKIDLSGLNLKENEHLEEQRDQDIKYSERYSEVIKIDLGIKTWCAFKKRQTLQNQKKNKKKS